MHKALIDRLDKVASAVEALGHKDLAEALDKVSNSLEYGRVVSPFDQVDHLDERLEYLEENLALLGKTLLVKKSGGEAIITKLKRHIATNKSRIADEGVSVVQNSAEAKAFLGWVEKCNSLLGGKPIPGPFFSRGNNTHESKVSDLAGILDILDEKLGGSMTQGMPPRNKPSLEEFAKGDQQEHAPRVWKDDPFVRNAYLVFPKKFDNLTGLIRSLKWADQPGYTNGYRS